MRKDRRSRPASSTCTHTTTRSCSGIRPRVRRCSTASPRCSAATAASRLAPAGARPTRLPHPDARAGRGHAARRAARRARLAVVSRSATGSPGSTVGSPSTPDSSSATRRFGWRRWATTRSAATRRPQQIEKMAALLGGALADGALGLSTSQSNTHNDGDGPAGPVAQCVARGAAGAGRSGPRASGHHARGDHPRLPVRLHRRRHRPAHRHVERPPIGR